MRLIIICGLLLVLFSGCSPYLSQPMREQAARFGEETRVAPMLAELPLPQAPIYVAVYKFRDQTGQYRPTDVGASWSTAVTQGATNILMRVLDRTPWFIPIERENVSNLIQERKIIRSTRESFGDKTPLPPLLFAGIILEGGIVSYDANIMTGGAGARYFGAGGSAEYRQDRVTVELRAVSTSNGRVTKTVHASKTILSQGVSGGLFRYVSFRRLLEAETGFTYNEPSEMAVTEAIEMAVYQLIVEGIQEKLWAVDSTQAAALALTLEQYNKMEMAAAQEDVRGRLRGQANGKIAIGAQVSSQYYQGDYGKGPMRPGVGLNIKYSPNSLFFFEGRGNVFRLTAAGERYWGDFTSGEINLGIHLLPGDKTLPYIYVGGGFLYQRDGRSAFSNDEPNTFDLKVQSGFGLEQMITDRISISGELGFHYFLQDQLDVLKMGQYNDHLMHAQFGIRYHLKD